MASNEDEKETAESKFDRLDYSGIRFPSDRLTIETVRRLHPEAFDHGYSVEGDLQPLYFLEPESPEHASDDLGGMLMLERVMVTFAYAESQGLPPPAVWKKMEVQEDLIALYCKFEIATGPQHAHELIRDIERQGRCLGSQVRR